MGRIRYGFSNLHYAVATEGTGGSLTYATPVAVKGAKSLAMSAAGSDVNEPADNVNWFSFRTNDGYTGTLEFEDTAAADTFLQTVLGQTVDSKGGVLEKANDSPKEFALLGQMELAGGTETGKRACFYRCVASRPDINAQTKEVGGLTVATNTVNITAMPRINDDAVKYTADSASSAYATFFSAVPEKAS